jgi:hypothetical protein
MFYVWRNNSSAFSRNRPLTCVNGRGILRLRIPYKGIPRVGTPQPATFACRNACRTLCKVPFIFVRHQSKLECVDSTKFRENLLISSRVVTCGQTNVHAEANNLLNF